MRREILRLENITLIENGEQYLNNLNFHVMKGEIMGILVSDAKGIEQLVNVICNNCPIEFGRVYFEGAMVNHYAHAEPAPNRVYVIESRSRLIGDLLVTDNLFVLRKGFKKYVINNRVLSGQVRGFLEEMGIQISPDARVADLTPFERCVVELLKAKLMGSRLIILDHLSNFLGQIQLKEFQRIIRQECEAGMSFLYIGNHHQEVFKIATRTALFAQGRIRKVFEADEQTDEALNPYIISFDLSGSQTRVPQEETMLQFRHVAIRDSQPIDFSLKKGECLTFLDKDNQVWERMVHVLTGQLGWEQGTIVLDGEEYHASGELDFLSRGLAVIPDNPTKTFLFREMTYLENLTFLLDRKVKNLHLKKSYLSSVRQEYEPLTGDCIDEMQIDGLDVKQKYGLAYYRIHLFHPKVAVCVQPLANGDMYCRRYILDLIQELKNSGISVLIITSNIADNLDVSDRLLVLREGKAMREYAKEDFGLVRR